MRPNPFAGASDEYAANPPPPHDVPPGAVRSAAIDELLAKATNRVFLDLGSNMLRAPGWTVMDDSPTADIHHDPMVVPWPLESESAYYIRCFKFLEHVPTACQAHPTDPMMDIFNEIWRVLCVGGSVWVSVPHASTHLALADPTNRRIFTEDTFKELPQGFEVGHGYVLDVAGDIVEMHVSLVKGGPSWLAQAAH